MTTTTAQRLARLAPAGTPSPERWAHDLIDRMRPLGLKLLDDDDSEQFARAAKALRDHHTCSEDSWSSLELAFSVLEAL